MCVLHYNRWYRTGEIGGLEKRPSRWTGPSTATCLIEGCDVGIRRGGRGWCSRHYQRWLKHGDPLTVKYPGRAIGEKRPTEYGYVQVKDPEHPRSVKGWVLEHVKVMGEVLGRPVRRDEEVHHKNGVRDDNRPENLELWVVHQPSGQRPVDLLVWAHEIIERYEKEVVIYRGVRTY